MNQDDEVRYAAAKGPFVRDWRYARAVRRGPLVEVSGTTAISPDGTVIAPGDAYEQTRAAIAIIKDALEEVGADLGDVIRTRIFLRDIADWRAAGRAHAEAFAEISPASSVVGGNDLLLPELLVEVEVTAFVTGTSGAR